MADQGYESSARVISKPKTAPKICDEIRVCIRTGSALRPQHISARRHTRQRALGCCVAQLYLLYLCCSIYVSQSATMPFVTQVTSSRTSVITRSSGGKINIQKQGLNSVKNDVVRKNLQGVSDTMKKGDWVDASGRKGTLLLLSRFQLHHRYNQPALLRLCGAVCAWRCIFDPGGLGTWILLRQCCVISSSHRHSRTLNSHPGAPRSGRSVP